MEIAHLSSQGGTTSRSPHRGSRRWLQISVRGLVGVVTLLCAALGWLAMRVEQARRQERAIEAMPFCRVCYDYEDWQQTGHKRVKPPPGPAFIRKAFGENVFADAVYLSRSDREPPIRFDSAAFANIKELTTLKDIYWNLDGGPPLNDADLVHLSRLVGVERLYLSHCQVTDAGLRHLSALINLRLLRLESPRIAGGGLAHLARCQRLDMLDLRVPITPEGFRAIERLQQLRQLWLRLPLGEASFEGCARLTQLHALKLNGQGVPGKCLRHLRGLKNLVQLSCEGIEIEPGDLKYLHDLPSLQELNLDSAKLSDEALADLRSLTGLRALFLSNTAVSDSGLKHLYPLKQLEWLDVQATAVTAKGLSGAPWYTHPAMLFCDETCLNDLLSARSE